MRTVPLSPWPTLLGPQSRFGDKLPRIWLVCPKNGTAVLKGLPSICPKCLSFLFPCVLRVALPRPWGTYYHAHLASFRFPPDTAWRECQQPKTAKTVCTSLFSFSWRFTSSIRKSRVSSSPTTFEEAPSYSLKCMHRYTAREEGKRAVSGPNGRNTRVRGERGEERRE